MNFKRNCHKQYEKKYCSKSDIELFEDNPEEYVWRDIEGSDVATRRRAACDLLRALATHYDDKMMAIFGQYVEAQE
ncbi:unnamed protein product [Danaus chrysippus]|uniref:(African queen) hypothetical protein n=1 Tax=Danaus chrysippus TaxID=151541 RepID=A0A8J2VVD6_9NEOP|nr:unnamed protein product [Danaus chrysippus]